MKREVAFHFKQWGDWAPGDGINLLTAKQNSKVTIADGTEMVRVGKKLAGRALDGQEWDQLPERASNW